jgi:hypothetical protein
MWGFVDKDNKLLSNDTKNERNPIIHNHAKKKRKARSGHMWPCVGLHFEFELICNGIDIKRARGKKNRMRRNKQLHMYIMHDTQLQHCKNIYSLQPADDENDDHDQNNQ